MISDPIIPDFTILMIQNTALTLLLRLDAEPHASLNPRLRALDLDRLYQDTLPVDETNLSDASLKNKDERATNWLMDVFNTLFAKHNVRLVRGEHEPEYFPAIHEQPARIEFAHGFFASALHELSHWCIASGARRQLKDFGYWYAADGRSATQQQAFERVEIKPQALECLFTLACKRSFQVSQDNLFAEFDTSDSTFTNDVYQQVKRYIAEPQTLPRDAQTLLRTLLALNIAKKFI